MQIPLLDLKRQYETIKDEIDAAIAGVIDRSQFIGGETVERFEHNFAQYLNVKHVVSCGNGTDALEIALKALGVQKGDEVIVPAYTWVATANAVVNVGANPVFCDVDPTSYCMDFSLLESLITPKTKAIIPVHLYGHPADMKAILEIAKANNLKVLEDCAQAHAAEIQGAKVGTFGDAAIFSFFPTKNLGALGDGGAIVTNDAAIARSCFVERNQGQEMKHVHLTNGRNSRLDTLQAAVLDKKLPHLDSWTAKRIQVAQWYDSHLTLESIKKPQVLEGNKHVYHLYVIQTPKRDALKAYLSEKGVSSLIHYPKPLTALDVFQPQGQIKFPIVNKLSENILSIPMFPELSLDEVVYICDQIQQFLA